MDELHLPKSPDKLAYRLRFLHGQRKHLSRPARRLSLTPKQRCTVLAKTAERCHICGGKITGKKFAADHVLAHAAGGRHSLDNYLPAHTACNGCRWFYSFEEVQWILKIGVWARKQMEQETPIGKDMAVRFWKHQKATQKRRRR